MHTTIQQQLKSLANSTLASKQQKFFKTNKNQYAQGDIFIGVTVPQIHTIAKQHYKQITLPNLASLLHSSIHEERFCALSMLVLQYKASKTLQQKQQIVDFYLHKDNCKFINHWDLVDLSSYKILGNYCYITKNYTALYNLANSSNLWYNRIAVVSNIFLVKQAEFSVFFDITFKLINHNHHLIHKAIGWVLREVGKKDLPTLINYLNNNYTVLPRITLSYATEKLSKEQKSKYYAK